MFESRAGCKYDVCVRGIDWDSRTATSEHTFISAFSAMLWYASYSSETTLLSSKTSRVVPINVEVAPEDGDATMSMAC